LTNDIGQRFRDVWTLVKEIACDNGCCGAISEIDGVLPKLVVAFGAVLNEVLVS